MPNENVKDGLWCSVREGISNLLNH